MRFLLGILLGFSMRGKKKPLITVLTTIALIVYVIVPTIALLALRLDVQRQRRMRPTQIEVPALKGLSFGDAESKLRASNLNHPHIGDAFRSPSSARTSCRPNP